MAIGTGLAGQLGCAEESTYGTAVTVTRFLEYLKCGLVPDIATIEAMALGRGPVLQTTRTLTYIKGAKGTIELPVWTKGMGMLFKHWLGSYANALVAGSERKATITPDAVGLQGLALTIQAGVPDVGGTVRPYTFEGCKVMSGELSAEIDDYLKFALEIDAETAQTATGLAAASYASADEALYFTGGSITVGGTSTFVRKFSLKGTNPLDADRRGLGNTKKEPLMIGERVFEGELECEFEDLTAYAAWVAGTLATLVATFTSPTNIAGGGPYKLVVTVQNIQYRGDPPKVEGPARVMQPRKFKCLNDLTNPVVKLEYHSTDAAA